ncbi:FAD-linked oxidase C-terminal domain-containing protein [Sphaerisporangium album]|uniref:FAD-linked oxidase C-terminal domain-containing protein n=1 Tax=Sphaerisporangium album TaxID=509200 RepID=UPI0015F06CA1
MRTPAVADARAISADLRRIVGASNSSPDEVARTVREMAELMPEHGATSVQVAAAAAESEALPAARRCALPALARLGGATMLEDVGVPRSRLPELVRRVDRPPCRPGSAGFRPGGHPQPRETHS